MGCDAYTILRVSDDGCDADGSVLAETDMSIWINRATNGLPVGH